jgi:hypothetical protein
MPYNYPPVARTAATQIARSVPGATFAMGGVGAIIGGTAAAAKNIRRVKEAEIKKDEAVKDTLREATGAGLATATATAVMGAVGATGLVSILGVIAVATGAKYFWDGITQPAKPQPAPAKKRPARKKA